MNLRGDRLGSMARGQYDVRTVLRRKISTTGNSAALVLSQDILGLMGIQVGDEVEVQLVDRTLIVRPVGENTRDAQVANAIERIVRRRAGLMERLAEGPGKPSDAGTDR